MIHILIVVGWEFFPCLGDNRFDIMMQFVSPLLFARCDLCPSSYLELLRRILAIIFIFAGFIFNYMGISYWLTKHVAKISTIYTFSWKLNLIPNANAIDIYIIFLMPSFDLVED